MTEQAKVGFIGLGLMGKPMARNLLKAGFDLTVHNRGRAKMEELAGEGAHPVNSPAEVARAATVVVSCLPGPADVEQVYLAPGGVLEGLQSGSVIVEMSTIDPGTHRRVAALAAERGAAYLDAPVSGGTSGAEKGTLTIMVGGEPEALAIVRPVLEAMGKRIYHLGPTGAGATAKLVNNLVGAINVAGLVEGMVLGVKAGLDPELLYEVVSNGSGGSIQFNAGVPNILRRDFEPGFSTALMRKDVNLALEMARDLGVRVLTGSMAGQMLQEAQSAGLGDRSFYSAIIPLEQNAGVVVKK